MKLEGAIPPARRRIGEHGHFESDESGFVTWNLKYLRAVQVEVLSSGWRSSL